MNGYVAFDIETTGLEPGVDQILSIGAVVDNNLDTPIDQLPYFHFSIDNGPKIKGDPFALSMNAGLLKLIGQGGIPCCNNICAASGHDTVQNVLAAYGSWLRNFATTGTVTYAGKNLAMFDFKFVEVASQLLSLNASTVLRFNHRVLDVGSMFYEKRDYDLGTPPNLVACLHRAGVADPVVQHTALDDCRDVIHCVRKRLHS